MLYFFWAYKMLGCFKNKTLTQQLGCPYFTQFWVVTTKHVLECIAL